MKTLKDLIKEFIKDKPLTKTNTEITKEFIEQSEIVFNPKSVARRVREIRKELNLITPSPVPNPFEKEIQTVLIKETKQEEKSNNLFAHLIEDFFQKLGEKKIEKKSKIELIEDNIIIVSVTDIHMGATIDSSDGLKITPDYNIDIIKKRLDTIASIVNSKKYKKVIINLLGDFIESFTGRSKINTFQQLQKGYIYNNAIIESYKILLDFIKSIKNVEAVFIVGGNHDRMAITRDEDLYSSGAALIAFMLDQSLSMVTYDPFVNKYKVNNHCFILTHGHLPSTTSKKQRLTTKPKYIYSNVSSHKFIFQHGDNTCFNVVTQGHLHKRDIIIDDLNARWLLCPPIFTGNIYSELLGYSTCPGFLTYNFLKVEEVYKLVVTDYSL